MQPPPQRLRHLPRNRTSDAVAAVGAVGAGVGDAGEDRRGVAACGGVRRAPRGGAACCAARGVLGVAGEKGEIGGGGASVHYGASRPVMVTGAGRERGARAPDEKRSRDGKAASPQNVASWKRWVWAAIAS